MITGVEHLRGSRMEACELRGGAALVLAGLAAEGESFVTDTGNYLPKVPTSRSP